MTKRFLIYAITILNEMLFAFLPTAMAQNLPIVVANPNYRLEINAKGSITSFRMGKSNHEFLIPDHANLPLFKIELRGGKDLNFSTVTSLQAAKVTSTKTLLNGTETILIHYEKMGSTGLGATVTIRCPQNEALTYWSIEVENPTKSWISNIQFPTVEVPFDTDLSPESTSSILSSLYDGVLSKPVTASTVMGMWRRPRKDVPEGWRQTNYPRDCTVQLLAYYNAKGGLYMAAEDPSGMPKLIAPLIESDGVLMGFGHYPGTQGPGKTKLPYEVALGTFYGDWYAAADIYRNWAVKQAFVPNKLAERTDIPKWLFQPVVGITFPMRGQGDWDPPAAINPEYTPATNAIPYLDNISKTLNAPLIPIVFNWEHSGPWVQPEAFPPVGGEKNMKKFMVESKAKGWHPSLYGDGINWVVKQNNTGYDGTGYFKAHGGDSAIVHYWWGKAKPTQGGWRSLYNTCVATAPARRMILGMTKGMAALGPSIIQQFDQGAGAVVCFATDHGHPPVPGPWMTKAFKSLLVEDNEAARSFDKKVVVSSEGAPPEVYLKNFQFWDARIGGGGSLNCSLNAYIYHEYILAHSGAYLNSVNDEAFRASVARATVKGYMLNFTLREKGLINFEWDNLWDRAIPDQVGILDWAKRATKFRNGKARDFLMFGQMQQPFHVTGMQTRDYGYGPEPLVQNETWKSQDGRAAVALANYANNIQKLKVEIRGIGEKRLEITIDDKTENRTVTLPYILDLQLPTRSFALVELK